MAPALVADHVKAPTAIPGDPPATRLPRRPPGLSTAPDGRRARASKLDSLAIGAPLTAAFVGVLLAEAGVAASGAQEPGAQAAATGAGDDPTRGEAGPGATLHSGGPATVAGSDGATSGAPAAQQAALDPVSGGTSGATAALPQADPAGGGRADGAASEVSAAVGGKAGSAGAASVSVTLLNLDDGAADGGAGIDDDDGADTGTIGGHVTGGDGDDEIHGTPGDDHIAGGAGDDVIYGHAGDDTLLGETGNDQLHGGAGDDLLDGGPGQDQLFGGDGDDALLGGTGADQLFGEAGDDELDGGPGNDLVDGGTGVDQLQGGTGDDVLVVDNLHDVVFNVPQNGGGGSDTLQVDDGLSDSLAEVGRPENVTFVFSANLGIDLPAGSEPYTQQVAPGIEHLVLEGAADHDALGDGEANRITGNDGANMIHGRGGDDVLSGGAGSDWLDGGAGSDRLEGDAGDDLLSGGDAADLLYGGAGDDVLDGGRGSDQLEGGAGNDTYVIGLNDSAIDTVFDHEGSNQLTLEGFAGGDVQTALLGDDLHLVVDHSVVAVISGYRGHEDAFAGIDFGQGLVPLGDLMVPDAGAGPAPPSVASTVPTGASTGADDLLSGYLTSPSLSGGAGADALTGTSGADWLSGLGGNDHLQGGAGDDVLEGGAGHDRLEGGAGDDRYLFKASDGGLDTIRDTEGSNFAELKGVAGARLEGAVVGNDLYVVADHAPIFKVEGFVGHEDAFTGVQADDGFVPTDDLF